MPLKRVNQAYVIATSTKVDIKGVDVSKFEDAYFKSTEKKVSKKGEDEFFETEPEKKVLLQKTPPPHSITQLSSLQFSLNKKYVWYAFRTQSFIYKGDECS